MPAYRVLVVDDTELNCKLVETVLKANGFEVLLAHDGEHGFEVAVRELPDLILMDVQLPKMDGYEVTRRLRLNEGTSQIPIVALTAHAMMGEEERARQAGCDGYLSKPINTRTLVEQLQVYLAE